MPQLSIESNGRIEKTALYFNGEQLSGVKEVFLNLNEDGTFDAVIQYEGSDGAVYSKQLFSDHLENIKTMPPAFTEDESQQMQQLSVESSGDIENTFVSVNEQQVEGINSLLVHIKAPKKNNSAGLRSLFGSKESDVAERGEFKAEITFRDADGSLSTEQVF